MRISTMSYGAALFAAQVMMAQQAPTDTDQYQDQQPGTTYTYQQPAGTYPQATGQYQQTTGAPCPSAAAAGVSRSVAAHNQQASRLAAQMIHATDMARKSIEANDVSQANAQITQAMNLARQIQQLQPNRRIVPIFAELESTSVLQPVIEARGGGQAVTAAPQPRTDQAQQQGVVVQQTTGQATFVGVDPASSLQHLNAAKMALSSNNPLAADDALRAVESNVITTQVSSDMPLLRARQNLALASTYSKQGRTQDASAALDEAASALDSYSQGGGRFASQAQNLAQQIRSNEANISQQPQQAVAQIDSWWNQAADWSQQT